MDRQHTVAVGNIEALIQGLGHTHKLQAQDAVEALLYCAARVARGAFLEAQAFTTLSNEAFVLACRDCVVPILPATEQGR